MGATHTLLVTPGMDVAAALKRFVRGGPDIVIDSVGAGATIAQALDAVIPGGTAVVVGLHEVKQPAAINPASLVYQNKRLLGSFFGGCKPQKDLPMLVNLYRAGLLPVDRLITAHYPLEELPRAFADMEAGTVARGVLEIGSAQVTS
jgi:Zn-dependent alcohol dehydrogenase